MNTKSVTGRMRVLFVFLSVFLSVPGVSRPVSAAEDIKSITRQADKALRGSEKSFFSRNYDQSLEQLNAASDLLEKIRSLDPGNARLKSLDGKYLRQKKKLDSKLGAAPAPTTGSKSAGASAVPDKKSPGEKLPGGVQSRLKKLNRDLDRAEKDLADASVPENRRSARVERSLAKSRETMQEISKRYAGQFSEDQPDFAAAKDRLDTLERQAAELAAGVSQRAARAEAAGGRQKVLEEEWGNRLREYTQSGGTRYFCSCRSGDQGEMERQKALYGELTALLEQYDALRFPADKSDWLLHIEQDARDRANRFPGIVKAGEERAVQAAADRVQREISFLDSKEEWKNDPGKRPFTLSEDRINEARQLVDQAARSVPADDPGLASLQSQMAELVRINNERRAIRTKRTRMGPDRFSGKGAGDVKAKAEALVRDKHPDARPLRATILSEDWKEETVEEWTDTTKSAVRWRTTRSLTAQVAVRRTQGVFLFNAHVARDKRSDGTWGPLYGNIMYSDNGEPMLAENVDK